MDTTRIKEYEYSLAGDFELSYQQRFKFFGRVNGLSYVELQTPRNSTPKHSTKGAALIIFTTAGASMQQ
jgi:hypothetical protein